MYHCSANALVSYPLVSSWRDQPAKTKSLQKAVFNSQISSMLDLPLHSKWIASYPLVSSWTDHPAKHKSVQNTPFDSPISSALYLPLLSKRAIITSLRHQVHHYFCAISTTAQQKGHHYFSEAPGPCCWVGGCCGIHKSLRLWEHGRNDFQISLLQHLSL